MSARPFRILGIQQIAIGGLDKQALRRFWIDTLGLELTGTYRSEQENVDEDTSEQLLNWYYSKDRAV